MMGVMDDSQVSGMDNWKDGGGIFRDGEYRQIWVGRRF